jgi:hypothetical protein
MKWEVKGATKRNQIRVQGSEKNSSTPPTLLKSCLKALTRVV